MGQTHYEVETAQPAWHVDVEDDQVRPVPGRRPLTLDRRGFAVRLVSRFLQSAFENVNQVLLVVDDQDSFFSHVLEASQQNLPPAGRLGLSPGRFRHAIRQYLSRSTIPGRCRICSCPASACPDKTYQTTWAGRSRRLPDRRLQPKSGILSPRPPPAPQLSTRQSGWRFEPDL